MRNPKIKLVLSLILLCTIKISAQSYIPFPDSNCVWSVGIKKFLVKGDSVLNTKIYKKYYVTTDTLLNNDSLNFVGLVRQDISQKKIYWIAKNQTNEKLLYNFNLNVDDTVHVNPMSPHIFIGPYLGPFLFRVKQKDSVLINGNYRRRLTITCWGDKYEEVWIEGVGSVYGPLSSGLTGHFCGLVDAYPPCYHALLCQKVNGVLVYVDSTFNSCYKKTAYVYGSICGLPGSLKEETIKNEFAISPNPTSNKLTIKRKDEKPMKESFIKLTDLLGASQTIKQINSSDAIEIDLSELSTGIYFLQISEKGKVLLIEKIIKN